MELNQSTQRKCPMEKSKHTLKMSWLVISLHKPMMMAMQSDWLMKLLIITLSHMPPPLEKILTLIQMAELTPVEILKAGLFSFGGKMKMLNGSH